MNSQVIPSVSFASSVPASVMDSEDTFRRQHCKNARELRRRDRTNPLLQQLGRQLRSFRRQGVRFFARPPAFAGNKIPVFGCPRFGVAVYVTAVGSSRREYRELQQAELKAIGVETCVISPKQLRNNSGKVFNRIMTLVERQRKGQLGAAYVPLGALAAAAQLASPADVPMPVLALAMPSTPSAASYRGDGVYKKLCESLLKRHCGIAFRKKVCNLPVAIQPRFMNSPKEIAIYLPPASAPDTSVYEESRQILEQQGYAVLVFSRDEVERTPGAELSERVRAIVNDRQRSGARTTVARAVAGGPSVIA